MSKNLIPVRDSTLDLILNWVTRHPKEFGCGATWLTKWQDPPMEGTLETLGTGAGDEFYLKNPWTGWFLLHGQVSKFQFGRHPSLRATKIALMNVALGLEGNGEPAEDEIVPLVERMAVTKGVSSPFVRTGSPPKV